MNTLEKPLQFLAGDIVPLVAMVAVFYLLRFFYFDFVYLGEDTYLDRSSFFLPWFTEKIHIAALAALSLPLLMPKSTWRSGDLRLFHAPLLLLILVLASRYSLSPFNLYLGEEYFLERVALLLLALASGLHPLFLPAFLVATFLFVGQLEPGIPNPLGWENKYPLFASLIGLHAFLLVRAIYPPAKIAHLIVILLSLQCAHYFHSGMEKLMLGPEFYDWVTHTRIDALFVSHYLGGWLPFRSEESVLLIASKIKEWNLELAVFVLILEVGTIIALFSRNFIWLLLYLLVGFHLAIFFMCGIFFWTWMLVNMVLLMLISRTTWHPEFDAFTLGRSTLAVLLVFFSAGQFTGIPYYHPVRLAWFDTPYGQIYKLKIVDDNDEEHVVPPFVMAPYHYQFIQNEFSYANREPQLAYHAGMVRQVSPEDSLRLVQALSQAKSLEEARSLYPEFASNRLDWGKRERLAEFLTTYFVNANHELQNEGDEIAALRVGPLKWAFPHLKRVKEVKLDYYDSFYTGVEIQKSDPKTIVLARLDEVKSDELEKDKGASPIRLLAKYLQQ